jgi:hypothetical protein
MIRVLDKLIFKDNTIPIVIVPEEGLGEKLCAYAPKGAKAIDAFGEEEIICPGECYIISKYDDETLTFGFNFLKEIGEIDETISLDAFLIEHAAHEVRHRVQSRLKIKLLSDVFLERDVKNMTIKSIIDFAKEVCREKFSGMRTLKAKSEFDAIIIGLIASKRWKGNNFLEISKLVKFNADKDEGVTLFFNRIHTSKDTIFNKWPCFHKSMRYYNKLFSFLLYFSN